MLDLLINFSILGNIFAALLTLFIFIFKPSMPLYLRVFIFTLFLLNATLAYHTLVYL